MVGNWLSIKEAAKQLGVSVSRVRQLAGKYENGKLKAQKLNERAWVFDRKDLEAYLKKHGVQRGTKQGRKAG